MRTIILGCTAAAVLGACSGEAAREPEKEAKAEALQPGEYEYTTKVDALRSTDDSTPATGLKVTAAGEAPSTARVCVTEEGIPPMTFAEAGDTCTQSSSYMRGGRLSLQFNCNRSGHGSLTQAVDGKFTADSFDAQVITSSYFGGAGDYSMTRTLTGKRIGECPPAKG